MLVTQKTVDIDLKNVDKFVEQVVACNNEDTSVVRPNCKLSNLSNGSFTIRSCHVLIDF